MQKSTGLTIALILMLVGIAPMLQAEEPSRAPLVEIKDIMVDGDIGPGGEYAIGTYDILVTLENTGNMTFIDPTTLHLTVDHYPSGTHYYNTSREFTPVIMEGMTVNLTFPDIYLEEGSFTILINGSVNGVEKSEFIVVEVTNVVDLSIDSDFFTEDAEYPPGEELIPTCNVTYIGNVQDWKDEVIINLRIELLETPVEVVYDRNMTIMDNESSPRDPGYVFSLMFDMGWTPVTTGSYRARFGVDYDNYNVSNNDKTVYFTVGSLPSIEGWVKTTEGTPVNNVTVDLWSTFRIDIITTDTDGYYYFEDIPEGTYDLEFSKIWSTSDTVNTTVFEGITSVVNATIDKRAVGGLTGVVYLPDGSFAEEAEVVINIPGDAPISDITNEEGEYSFGEINAGTIQVVASLMGYDDDVVSDFTLIEQIWNELDLELSEIPFTVAFDPPDGEPGFPVGGTLSLEFSRPINSTTVNETTIYLMDLSTSQNVPISFAFLDDYTVLIAGQEALDHSTDYRITVTTFLEDINGNNFPNIAYSDFTTDMEMVEIDLVSYYPGSDQSDVPVDIRIRAVFPVPMDGSTITESTFQCFISGGGGTPIAGTVVYYSGNYTAEFIPLDDLQYSGRYSVSLGTDIEALDPINVYRGTQWSFETIPLITTGSIVGFVLDNNAEPFSPDKVTIIIENEQGVVNELNTDLDGKFERAGLSAGVWTLTVMVPDHETYSTEFNIVAGESTIVSNIIMKEEEGKDGINIGTIILIILLIVILLILAYVFLGRKEKQSIEEEDHPRGRPTFSSGRPVYEGPAYDELAEGEFLCPVCGEIVQADDPDCPNCGSEFEEDLFECPECGAMVPGDAPECPDCGSKFEEEPAEEGEEEDLYTEEEEDLDITDDYEVDEMDEDDVEFIERE